MKKEILIIIGLTISGGLWSKGLRIGYDHWPPYQTQSKNNLTGFSVEVIQSVLNKLNVPISIMQPYSWERALLDLKTGKIDALFSANYNKDRTLYSWYPDEPIITSSWILWTNRNQLAQQYHDLSDLKGYRVGAVTGYTYSSEFWKQTLSPKVYLEEVRTDEQNFKKLQLKRLDYIIAEYGNGVSILKKLSSKVQIHPITQYPVTTMGLYIIFGKKTVSQKFVENFSKALELFKKGKQYKKIYQKYFQLP